MALNPTLIPRKYQHELSQRARDSNSILYAGTGTGKTLIASMVIKWSLQQAALNSTERKVAVFLVPQVPLVHQQKKFLEETTTLRIEGYHGAMDVDLWDTARWEEEFNRVDVLVMTAQIFKNILAHSYWSLQQVAVLILDEAHNCAKKHPYAQVMEEHYHHTPIDKRPRVLGLTASPLRNTRNPLYALKELQRLSDCTIFDVIQEQEELSRHSFKASCITIEYEPSPPHFTSYTSPSLWEELHAQGHLPCPYLDKPGEEANSWYRNAFSRWEYTKSALGPHGGDIFLHSHLEGAVDGLRQSLPSLAFVEVDQHKAEREYVRQVSEVLKNHHERLFKSDGIIPESWISPKLEALRKALTKESFNNWRGIVFVNQRQIATTLPLLISRLSGLEMVRAMPLVGHSESHTSEVARIGSRGMSVRLQERVTEEFRVGKANLLISTSVGQEGLDFPECSFVCMFEPPLSVSALVQSRGRARRATSKYIIMVQGEAHDQQSRLDGLLQTESIMANVYRRNTERFDQGENWDLDDDNAAELGSMDETQRYVVPKTGAVVTWSSAISLLNNLCSLIPHDTHTPPQLPKYEVTAGQYTCTVKLPTSLPIPAEKREIASLECTTKKNAKRSAAFFAVVELHKLGVFDNNLTPIRKAKAEKPVEDIDGKPPVDVSSLQEMMECNVVDPWGDIWQPDARIYAVPIRVQGRSETMALVMGNGIGPLRGVVHESREAINFELGDPVQLTWSDPEERQNQLRLMEMYTMRGIELSITRRVPKAKSTLLLVPFDLETQGPDYRLIQQSLDNYQRRWQEGGNLDSSDVYLRLGRQGPNYLVVGTVDGISVEECLDRQPKLARYVQSIQKRYPSFTIPAQDTILSCRRNLETTSAEYRDPDCQKKQRLGTDEYLFPSFLCNRILTTSKTLGWFKLLPPLTRHLSDHYRAGTAISLLDLSSLDVNLVTEAFVLPSSNASFSNQRLETLGDSFLKLATTIYLFHLHPHKHEGQLTLLRQTSVSNRYLMGRGHLLDLTKFMTNEPNNHRSWRLTNENSIIGKDGISYVKRHIARRSIQDCMESLIGAGYLSGGIPAGLLVGTNLGLCFGGVEPWDKRWPRDDDDMDVVQLTPPNLVHVEEVLGYQFKNKRLMVEAITHPSFYGSGPSYQRLEFLGDALLDFVVIEDLFRLYPNATPGKLTNARSRCVCNPALTAVGIKKLQVYKTILSDSVSLMRVMNATAAEFEAMSYEEVVASMWKLDPPKAIGDVVEALIGAVFIDSGCSYPTTKDVVLRLVGDYVSKYVHPDMPPDPTAQFMMWIGQQGCVQVHFRKDSSSEEVAPRKDQIFVVAHGKDIGPPAEIKPKTTVVIPRAIASQQAWELMRDPESEYYLKKLCDCHPEKVEVPKAAVDLMVNDAADLDEDTADGFAIAAQMALRAADIIKNSSSDVDDDAEQKEEEEVEALLDTENDEYIF